MKLLTGFFIKSFKGIILTSHLLGHTCAFAQFVNRQIAESYCERAYNINLKIVRLTFYITTFGSNEIVNAKARLNMSIC